MQDKIICAYPKAQYLHYKEEIDKAIKAVLEEGWYILGEEVKKFEKSFAEYLGLKHCIGVANGTDALCLAMRAVGVKPGDEVITTTHSAVATVAAVEQIGAIPVFCDIEDTTFCIDPEKIPALVTEKTKAIVAVHIYGQPGNIKGLLEVSKKYNLKLIEDCAQAHGARVGDKKVGTFGDIAAFSFYPTKNLGAIGDGGAVACNSDEYADNLKMLREYGWKERYVSQIPGINTRLDELQAAILSVKLKYLEADNEKRREIAGSYTAAINKISNSQLKAPNQVPETTHAMHLYVIRSDKRDELKEHFARDNIFCGIHYPLAIHQQTAYLKRIRGFDKLFVAENLYKNILSLPMYPELTGEEVKRITDSLTSYFN